MTDPFDALGLPPDANEQQVRAARRRLAKDHHPDAGGGDNEMAALNDAADQALRAIAARRAPAPTQSTVGGVATDMPSFTVEALPVETFEALLVVASWIGEVLDDDPPYRLEVILREPSACWCGLDLVPDAGASTVSLQVASIGGQRAPDVEAVRDVWIAHLNQLDWN